MEFTFSFDERKLRMGFVNIEKANTLATRNTLNVIAGLSRKNAVKNVKEKFYVRRAFTIRNIQFEKTEATKISAMRSRVGATDKASYMATQETGGIRKPSSGNTLAIPHTRKARGSAGKLIKKEYRIRAVRRRRVKYASMKKTYKSQKAHNVARAYVSMRDSKPLIRSKGVYGISNFKKASRNEVSFRSNMIYNKKHSSVKIGKTPWLEPATKQPVRDAQNIYNSQVNKLLKGDII